MSRLVTFGETMVSYNAKYAGPYDSKRDGPYEVYCAGAESNVCLDIERLGAPGLETVWISRLGMDDEGESILRSLEGRTTPIAPRVPGYRSGVAYVNHLEDGTIEKTYRRRGSAASSLTFQDVRPHLAGADVLHVTGITPALSDTARDAVLQSVTYAQELGTPVAFDVNYRAPLWSPDEARAIFDRIIPHSWVFKAGRDEAETVWGWGLSAAEYARRFQRTNGRLAIITRDVEGALAYDGATMVESAGLPIDVVDPVGAGDAFMAGFFAELFRRGSLREFFQASELERAATLERCLAVANVCGALICARRGDTESMPTMQEVEAFLGANADGKSQR